MPDLALSPAERRRRRLQKLRVPAVAAILVIAGGVGVMRMAPAAPTVDGGPLWFDNVQRGELVREVRGSGTLVPVDTAWIPASTDGRVARILLRPGAEVEPDAVILELENPALVQEVVDTRLLLEGAEARLRKADADATTALLTQEAQVAKTEADYEDAKADAEADASLLGDGLVSELQHRRSASRARSLQTQVAAERKRLDVGQRMRPQQIAEQQAEVSRMRALLALKQEQLGQLRVQAGMKGVLQAVPVEVGSQVAAGTNVARVADPRQLKAQVRVPMARRAARFQCSGWPATAWPNDGRCASARVRCATSRFSTACAKASGSCSRTCPPGIRWIAFRSGSRDSRLPLRATTDGVTTIKGTLAVGDTRPDARTLNSGDLAP